MPLITILESIVLFRHSLLNCSGAVHYCHSLILSELCNRGLTGLSTIDRPRIANWLWSPPNAIAWTEQCFLGSWGIMFVLARIGRADCTFRRIVPFPLLCMGNSHFTFISMGQNETKMSPFFLLPLHVTSMTAACEIMGSNLIHTYLLIIALLPKDPKMYLQSIVQSTWSTIMQNPRRIVIAISWSHICRLIQQPSGMY